MSLIKYAVVVFSEQEGLQVEHLYQHLADAERCATAYASQLGLEAHAVALSPPLAVSRRADAWGALSAPAPGRGVLRLYGTPEEAADAGGTPAGHPVRRGMPTQRGVPQFALARPDGALADEPVP